MAVSVLTAGLFLVVGVPLCLRNGARERREKGMRGVGWEADVTSPDPTLDAVGTRSWRSGVACPKNVQRQYL